MLLSHATVCVIVCCSVVDADGSGTIDANEFLLIMDELQSRANLPKVKGSKQ